MIPIELRFIWERKEKWETILFHTHRPNISTPRRVKRIKCTNMRRRTKPAALPFRAERYTRKGNGRRKSQYVKVQRGEPVGQDLKHPETPGFNAWFEWGREGRGGRGGGKGETTPFLCNVVHRSFWPLCFSRSYCLLIRWLLIIFTFDARRLVWMTRTSRHLSPPFSLSLPSLLSLFFLCFSLAIPHLSISHSPPPSLSFLFPLSSLFPFSRNPSPPSVIQSGARRGRFFTLEAIHRDTGDIDVLTAWPRGKGWRGRGCLWIGSFAYRPGLWFPVACLTSEPRVETFACEVSASGIDRAPL